MTQTPLQHDCCNQMRSQLLDQRWVLKFTIQIHFLHFKVTIIVSLFEILLTTAMKLQGFACKPQKSLYLHFFIKKFHFVATLSVQLPPESSAKEK